MDQSHETTNETAPSTQLAPPEPAAEVAAVAPEPVGPALPAVDYLPVNTRSARNELSTYAREVLRQRPTFVRPHSDPDGKIYITLMRTTEDITTRQSVGLAAGGRVVVAPGWDSMVDPSTYTREAMEVGDFEDLRVESDWVRARVTVTRASTISEPGGACRMTLHPPRYAQSYELFFHPGVGESGWGGLFFVKEEITEEAYQQDCEGRSEPSSQARMLWQQHGPMFEVSATLTAEGPELRRVSGSPPFQLGVFRPLRDPLDRHHLSFVSALE